MGGTLQRSNVVAAAARVRCVGVVRPIVASHRRFAKEISAIILTQTRVSCCSLPWAATPYWLPRPWQTGSGSDRSGKVYAAASLGGSQELSVCKPSGRATPLQVPPDNARYNARCDQARHREQSCQSVSRRHLACQKGTQGQKPSWRRRAVAAAALCPSTLCHD